MRRMEMGFASVTMVVAMSTFMLACGGDDSGEGSSMGSGSDPGPTETSSVSGQPTGEVTGIETTTTGALATLRFVHLHGGETDDVDVRIVGDDEVLFSELALEEASFPTDIPVGEFAFEFLIHVPGGGVGMERQVVAASAAHEFREGYSYSVTLYSGEDGPDISVFEDDLSVIPEEETRLRGVHAAPNVGSVSVSLTPYRLNEDSRIEPTGDPIPFVSDLTYREVSMPGEFEGLLWYLIAIDSSGDGETDVLFRTPSPLTPGFNTNAYIMERDGETVIFAHVLTLDAILPVPLVDPADVLEP